MTDVSNMPAVDLTVPEAKGEGTEIENTKKDSETISVGGFDISGHCPEKLTQARDNVKYGHYEHFTYYSEICGMERAYSVFFPADYEASSGRKYPVLYLQHGIFGNERTFMDDPTNALKEMFGNMAADGIADEWLIILPDMFCRTNPEVKPEMTAESILNYDNFINELINELMPLVESTYPVLTGRENTAIAGFSLGGRETLFVSLKETERFAYVCAMAPAPGLVPGKDWAMKHPGQMSEAEVKFDENTVKPDVLMICCGTKDSVVGKFPMSYHELMERNGVEHIWFEVPDAAHDNGTIRSGLYNLLRCVHGIKQK